jgi:hypothetical protein
MRFSWQQKTSEIAQAHDSREINEQHVIANRTQEQM